MAKVKTSSSIGAAECARRTGVTVRALRVYERQGLIEPMRSAKGWRCYGSKELARLNAIMTLKALGLTLVRIRGVLSGTSPPLTQVLQMQLGMWRARQVSAEQGLGLVHAALARLESRQQLSVQELCDLARGMDMSNRMVVTRELINESITAEEERAYMTWWAARPPAEAVAMRDYSAALRGLFRSLQVLMTAKVDPAAAEVQALIDQWNQTALRYQLRRIMLELIDWNASIAHKWFDVGRRALTRSVSAGESAAAHDVWDFFALGVKASGWSQALDRLIDEAALLSRRALAPSSLPARTLASRFAQICRAHGLGDPVIYARWAGSFALMRQDNQPADVKAQRRGAWEYLGRASATAATKRRGTSG
jgi:MerR family transcriptional regulator, thiopeptide resistance regulator